MKVLVLGGTLFLSKAVAAEAVRRGHDVTCACRGTSGAVPEGATHLVVDRSEPLPEHDWSQYDAVVDVGRHPSRVRAAVAAAPDAHWVFVSTISVYSDTAVPGGRPGVTPEHDPIHDDVDLAVNMEAYGPMKVSCEQAVLDGAVSAMVIRPGLIIGPGDPSGRFTYWPVRLRDAATDGQSVLVPGTPDDSVQVIDVRDLAAWIVDSAEQRRTGVVDGIGRVMRFADLLDEVARGVGSEPSYTWAHDEFLTAHEVDAWVGPDSLPMWLPRPEYDGMLAHDADLPREAGLVTRPVAESARDTLAWVDGDENAVRTGISREREAELLEAWRQN